jgi:predicted ArsR family transcriptional regulator
MTLATYPHAPGFKEPGGASQEAAERIAPKAAPLRARVLALFQMGVEATADEIADELKASILSVRPRIAELHRQGRITQTDKRRANASGMNATVWKRA